MQRELRNKIFLNLLLNNKEMLFDILKCTEKYELESNIKDILFFDEIGTVDLLDNQADSFKFKLHTENKSEEVYVAIIEYDNIKNENIIPRIIDYSFQLINNLLQGCEVKRESKLQILHTNIHMVYPNFLIQKNEEQIPDGGYLTIEKYMKFSLNQLGCNAVDTTEEQQKSHFVVYLLLKNKYEYNECMKFLDEIQKYYDLSMLDRYTRE